MTNCPVCRNSETKIFLKRHNIPVFQNLVLKSRSSALNVPLGELEMAVCHTCGFVFNQSFNPSLISYGQYYDNTQSYSLYFDSYLDDLVREIVQKNGVRDCRIVEVGCGKGSFLRKLVTFPASNNIGFGFDPSYVGPQEDLDGRLKFNKCYYNEDCINIEADIIICRHVIEHVPDPLKLLHSIRMALVASPKARVFFETPCVDWIFRNRVIWDFFYEHCSLFSVDSLVRVFKESGFAVDSVKHIFEGQYLWLEAHVSTVSDNSSNIGETVQLAESYARDELKLINAWSSRIHDLNTKGRISIWGAGAKGVTFANIVDHNNKLIDSIIDINPNKQGGYTPGSGHLILSPTDIPGRDIKFAILMNSNYRDEILLQLKNMKINLELIDWSDR